MRVATSSAARRLRVLPVALLASLAAAGTAVAAEPAWGPFSPLPGGGQLPERGVVPLSDGGFLVMTQQYAQDRAQDPNPYAVRIAHVAEDGSSTDDHLAWTMWDGSTIASSQSGTARVVWNAPGEQDGYSGEGLWTSLWRPGQGFGAASQLPVPCCSARVTRVAMNAHGDSVVAFANGARVWAVFIDAGGAVAGPVAVSPLYEDNSHYAWSPQVTLSDSGEAVVAWTDATSHSTCTETESGGSSCVYYEDQRVVAAAVGTAAGFGPPQAIGDLTEEMIRLVADRQGGAAVAWRRPDGTLAVALRPPGGSFGMPRTLGGSSMPPVLAATPNGQLVIAVVGPEQDGYRRFLNLFGGSTKDATLGDPFVGEEAYAVAVGAGWDEARLIAWQGPAGLRSVWMGADGVAGNARNLPCSSGTVTQVAMGPARPFLLTSAWQLDGTPLLAFALGRVGAEPAAACPPPQPSAPIGGVPGPVPPITWRVYNNVRRSSTSLISPPAPDAKLERPAHWADGGSDNAAISQDNRNARLFAFDSAATGLVAGDGNGRRDVFVMRRAPGGGNLYGKLTVASVGPNGLRANGPSVRPSLDGETHRPPHCVAFESNATNLDPGDTTPDSDIYVRDLRRGRTTLLSAGLRDATGAVVDGSCNTVTFAAQGWVWVTPIATRRPLRLARGTDADQQTNGNGAAYERGGQVRYRKFQVRRQHGRTTLRRWRERLVSIGPRGRPANGTSRNPSMDDNGHYVGFESMATDLCPARRCAGVTQDGNGRTWDVFRRTLSKRAPTRDVMQMVSFSQSDGDNGNAVISGAGENVLFESTSLRSRHGGPISPEEPHDSRVFSWTFPRARGYGHARLVKRRCRYFACNGATGHPAMSSRGNYIAYSTVMREFCNALVAGIESPRPCPSFTDVLATYVGPSHEGYPLG